MILNLHQIIIVLSAAIYFQLDFIWVLLNIKTIQIGRLRVNMANSGKCRNKNEMQQLNNSKWKLSEIKTGDDLRFQSIDPDKSFGSGKILFERQTNLSGFIYQPFSTFLSRLLQLIKAPYLSKAKLFVRISKGQQ